MRAPILETPHCPFPNHLSACVLSRLSHVQLFATLWTAALQTPLSIGFSRQEYWIGLPYPPLGDLPDPGIEPMSLMSPALAGGFFTTSATQDPQNQNILWSPKDPPVCWLFIISLCQPSFGSLNGCPHLKTTLSVDLPSSSAVCSTLGSMNLSRGISPSTKKTWGLETAALLAQPVLGEERVPSSGLCLELLWIGVRAQPRIKQTRLLPSCQGSWSCLWVWFVFLRVWRNKEQQEASWESSPDCAVTAFLSWEVHQRSNPRASDGSKVDGDIGCFLKGLWQFPYTSLTCLDRSLIWGVRFVRRKLLL